MSMLRVFTVGPALLLGVGYFWRRLRRQVIARETAFFDAEFAGIARNDSNKIKGTVVICGGSIAGLIAARACHNHFERVVIVEAESWLDTEDARKVLSWTQENKRTRVMQYTSVHGQMAILCRCLSFMFPGFKEECIKSGVSVSPGDYNHYFFGHKSSTPRQKNPDSFIGSRRALETLLRRLTLNPEEYPNVEQIIGTVTGLTRDPNDNGRLSQVTVRMSNATELALDAALVIDCTGPSQMGQKWIERAGFTAKKDIPRESFDPKMHYTTHRFENISRDLEARLPIPSGFDDPTPGILGAFPDLTRENLYFTVFKQENRSIHLCCGQWGGKDRLPTSYKEIKPYLQSLVTDKPYPQWIFDFLDVLGEVEDTMDMVTIAVGPSYWTHFERAKGLPSNWIAIGDAVSRINPLFGQGCGKATIGVMAMNTILHNSSHEARLPDNFAQRFFQSQADKINSLWQGTKALDYSQSTTIPIPGETLEVGWFARWYSHHLQILTETDKDLATTVTCNTHGIDTVSVDMIHPVILAKALWSAWVRHG